MYIQRSDTARSQQLAAFSNANDSAFAVHWERQCKRKLPGKERLASIDAARSAFSGERAESAWPTHVRSLKMSEVMAVVYRRELPRQLSFRSGAHLRRSGVEPFKTYLQWGMCEGMMYKGAGEPDMAG